MDPASGREALASLQLFASLPSRAFEDVLALVRIRPLPRGMQIFDQGELAERAHALLAGSVRISQAGSDGEQVVIRFIGPGEIFGSVALFTDRHYPADAVAMVDSSEASWSETELRDLSINPSQLVLSSETEFCPSFSLLSKARQRPPGGQDDDLGLGDGKWKVPVLLAKGFASIRRRSPVMASENPIPTVAMPVWLARPRIQIRPSQPASKADGRPASRDPSSSRLAIAIFLRNSKQYPSRDTNGVSVSR